LMTLRSPLRKKVHFSKGDLSLLFFQVFNLDKHKLVKMKIDAYFFGTQNRRRQRLRNAATTLTPTKLSSRS
jgi:hypothetical protein